MAVITEPLREQIAPTQIFDPKQMRFIAEIEEELERILEESSGTIREMCLHTLKAGGKRIRPILVRSWGKIGGAPPEAIMKAAVAAELIHMASLVHDDIIDDAPIRRNKISVREAWGNHQAVLAGDFLFAKAFGILAEGYLNSCMQVMVEAIQSMCQGEIIQAESLFKPDTSQADYLSRIFLKTAALFESSCLAGALIGKATPEELTAVRNYGKNLGLAFQIMDDILDFTGDPAKMGKPKFEDFKQGNLTLPVILLLETESAESRWVREVIQSRDFYQDNLERLEQVLVQTGLLNQAYHIGIGYLEAAKGSLTGLTQNSELQFLGRLVEILRDRAN